MADSFFGFNSNLDNCLDDGLDLDDEEYGDEDRYNALNDETFGTEANNGDWEQDHEKLSQINESKRVQHIENDNYDNLFDKSDSEIDVERTLSHLVIDEKEITIPKPGVWDSPNLPLPPPKKPSLTEALKNACTVEELERGLINNRPPPGLTKPAQTLSNNSGNLFFNSGLSTDKIQQLNGTSLPHQNNQHPIIFNQNLRLPHPQFHMQNVKSMQNQPCGNPNFPYMFPPPPPHMMMPHGNQRPFNHGNFPLNNFPHPPPHNHGMGPLPYLRPDHPLLSHFPNNHPLQQHIHGGNQRSKQFHHNEQQQQPQPFFKNNQYYQFQNYNPKFYQNQNNHHHNFNNQHQKLQGTNGINSLGERDEYAGLMNTREKQWLNNIQLLQLNSNQPYIDDFYYTVFCDRLNRKNEMKNKNQNNRQTNGKLNNNNNNNNGYHRDSRDQHTFTKGTNTPMQFENSLGKLQYSSVTAPRKIIDMDVVPNSDPSQTQSIQQRDTKKTRQLLLEIERLYILLLKLEDRSNPIAIIAECQREQQQREQQQQQREAGEEVVEIVKQDPIKLKEELTLSILNSLIQCIKEDKFASLLSIRKGKTLFLRFLSCLNVKEYENQLVNLWVGVIKGLIVIGRRDSHLLINFYVEFRKWIVDNHLNNVLFNDLLKGFMTSSNQEPQRNNIIFALTNKFGISMISLMIKHAEELIAVDNKDILIWSDFIKMIGESIISLKPIVAPCEVIDSATLTKHLIRNNVHQSMHEAFKLHFTEINPMQ